MVAGRTAHAPRASAEYAGSAAVIQRSRGCAAERWAFPVDRLRDGVAPGPLTVDRTLGGPDRVRARRCGHAIILQPDLMSRRRRNPVIVRTPVLAPLRRCSGAPGRGPSCSCSCSAGGGALRQRADRRSGAGAGAPDHPGEPVGVGREERIRRRRRGHDHARHDGAGVQPNLGPSAAARLPRPTSTALTRGRRRRPARRGVAGGVA